jgi:DNA-binding NarL/FixJ family response regulator
VPGDTTGEERARIRVLLADDHDVVRRGLAMVLEADGAFIVIAEARDGEEAIVSATRLRPDLVILDVKMPVVDGVKAARCIKQEAPEVMILMLTGIGATADGLSAFRGAADGYLLKDATPEELLHAARCVAAGRPYLQGSLIRRLLGTVPPDDGGAAAKIVTPLTARELDILGLMATSHTNREIAERLFVGEETVRSHVKHILRKLGQPDRTKAVIAAVRAGILDLG